MANLGNAWHLPASAEPAGRPTMRDPFVLTSPSPGASLSPAITVTTGNQSSGGGNFGNQLQVGSDLFYRQGNQTTWTDVPLLFATAVGNNKYYAAQIPTATLNVGAVVEYYLRIAYSDHDTTFLRASTDGRTSLTTGDELAARASPFQFAFDTPATRGQWSGRIDLPNVAIHAHLLPDGHVLMWGRRDGTDQSLDTDLPSPLVAGGQRAPAANCVPFLWDSLTGTVIEPPPDKPTLDGTRIANLFCSGHAFLPDGKLLVAGGHRTDGMGLDQASTYDPSNRTWSHLHAMNHGRWYPTAITLPDGTILVLSGSYEGPTDPKNPTRKTTINNTTPQVWTGTKWRDLRAFSIGSDDPTDVNGVKADKTLELYPRVHVASSGSVIMVGSLAQTWLLDPSNAGSWTQLPGTTRINGLRDYAASVMYDVDKIIYMGGGPNPTANAETIDLAVQPLRWVSAQPMFFPRRQHNATILPDGTVLVTGGTSGNGFNDLTPGQPVHYAEMWEPSRSQPPGSGKWTVLAAEHTDRCYHSTAVLLPDATVLSAGGGEYYPTGSPPPNPPAASHRDAQVFSPPYLFKGEARPEISSVQTPVRYGDKFPVGTANPSTIGDVTLIRIASVTHGFNTGQHFNRLDFTSDAGGLMVNAPTSAAACPPGHYMLFILSRTGVPSKAKIVQIQGAAVPPGVVPPGVGSALTPASAQLTAADDDTVTNPLSQRDAVLAGAQGTAVTVGITGTCPYGIAACWGGANEALHGLDGVQYVDPVPDGATSTARVFLGSEVLPALHRWDDQFYRMVNGSYVLRGVEVTLEGEIYEEDGALFLAGRGERPAVRLTAFDPTDKVQWDRTLGAPEPPEPGELEAYASLGDHYRGSGRVDMTITGPLQQANGEYQLEVRLFG